MLEFQVEILFIKTINYARIPGYNPFTLTQLTMLEFQVKILLIKTINFAWNPGYTSFCLT